MTKPLAITIAWAALGAASPVLASGISQGETPATALCVDTGHPRITKLCANVSLRYKVDALLDLPMSNFGLQWSPTSWTLATADGTARALPVSQIPAPLAKALALATLQLKGTALVDFSAATPLQFLPYQTVATAAQDRSTWSAASRPPVEKWLYSQGGCQDTPHHAVEPAKALTLFKVGIKSMSIDPKTSAGLCKSGTEVGNLQMASRVLERLCKGSPNSAPQALPALCGAPLATAPQTDTTPALMARWSALLDEGVPPMVMRPSVALLDEALQPARMAQSCALGQAPQAGCAPAQTLSSAEHFPQ